MAGSSLRWGDPFVYIWITDQTFKEHINLFLNVTWISCHYYKIPFVITKKSLTPVLYFITELLLELYL